MRTIVERHKFHKPIETESDADGAWEALKESFPEFQEGRRGALISTTTGNIYITEDTDSGEFNGTCRA